MTIRPDGPWGPLLCLAAWGVLLAAPAAAADDGGPTLKGFGTLGLARSNSDRAQYVRDLSQPYGVGRSWSGEIDSLVGVQVGLKLGERTDGALQAVSRYRCDGSYAPELTWAYVRRELAPDADLRVGRLGTEFYMLADSRLVGYANLTVRPPPDYYGPLVLSYFDGADASLALRVGDGLLRGKLFAGYSPEKTPLVGRLAWDLDGSLLVGGHLDYAHGPWQVRAGHTRVRFRHELPLAALVGVDVVAAAPEMSVADRWTRFDSLGAVYDDGPLQLHAMLSRIEHQSAAYEDGRAGYVVAGYRLGAVTPYLGVSRTVSSPNTPSGVMTPELYALVSGLMSQTHSDQHTVFLGGRWDIQPNVALKAQLDLVRGSPRSVFPVRETTPDWNGRLNVFSVTLDFLF